MTYLGLGRCVLFMAAASLWCCAPVTPAPEEQLAARALIDRGTLQLRHGELERARASYQVSYDLARSAEALDGLGCVAVLNGDYGSAERYLLAAIEADPGYSQAYANLALLYDLQGRKPEAEGLYRRALQMDPLYIRARSNFGAFLSDSVSGATFEGRTELLHAQALEDSPLLRENLRKVEERYGKE